MADDPGDMSEHLGKVRDALAKMMEMHGTASKHLDNLELTIKSASDESSPSTKSKSPLYDNK